MQCAVRNDGAPTSAKLAKGERNALANGAGFVEQASICDREAGELGDQGLKGKEQLEAAL